VEHVETVGSKSDKKQVEWSGKGEKRKEIIQRSFLHFFVYSPSITELWTVQEGLA
jgi:hypothetical protein